MTIKIDDSRSAAVNTDIYWLPIDRVPPPRGVKLLLINEAHGVAVLSDYTPQGEWTHWQGLPKFVRPSVKRL